VLIREDAAGPELLLGRRHRRAAFLPDIYVFPGGRVDDSDHAPSGFPEALSPDFARQLAADRPGRSPLAFPRAAIRETFEETGLLVAEPAAAEEPPGAPPDGVWGSFAAHGLAPAFSRLEYVCRAITPTSSHRRYNTRFFLVRGAAIGGSLAGDGELDDLAWWPLAEIPRLNLVDVTAFVLEEALRLWRSPPRGASLPPLACYRSEVFRIRRR
jgi:8-oxo-dGTP pyrophosphatase MutT (NUDIX family)